MNKLEPIGDSTTSIQNPAVSLWDKIYFYTKKCLMNIGLVIVLLVASALVGKTVSKQNIFLGDQESIDYTISVFNFFSLLLIFPFRINRVVVLMGIITTPAWLLFGPIQVAAVWIALQAVIVRTLTEKPHLSIGRIIAILLLAAVLINIGDTYPLSIVPTLFWPIFAGLTLVGSVLNLLGAKGKLPFTLYKLNSIAPLRQDEATPITPLSATEQMLELHRQKTNLMVRESQALPADFTDRVLRIGKQAIYILGCMKDDPRDIAPGDKFLNRYLDATQLIVQNLKKMPQPIDSNGLNDPLVEQSRQLLARLEIAFTEQHKRLKENDTDDFIIELNVLDKLLNMEGVRKINPPH